MLLIYIFAAICLYLIAGIIFARIVFIINKIKPLPFWLECNDKEDFTFLVLTWPILVPAIILELFLRLLGLFIDIITKNMFKPGHYTCQTCSTTYYNNIYNCHKCGKRNIYVKD